jgi:hypothetical protein
MRRVSFALALAIGAVLVAWGGLGLTSFLSDFLKGLVDSLIARVGEVWAVGIIGGTTIVLAALWLFYGGPRVVRWFGIVLKPARPEEGPADAGSGSERAPPLVGPRN